MTCPTPEAIVLYVAADASLGAIQEIEQHVDQCDACRRTVAATIRAARTEPVVHDDGLAVGSTVDRYVIRGARGSGAMGHVYEAGDPELGRSVALKVVRHHDDAGDARALREGRALAKLAHPNVVAVYDVGTFTGGVFLAMELVAGATVAAWARSTRPTVRQIVEVFAGAARGLAAAHAAGLVHRDIKPDNLLVGDDGRVRVIDFGLAVAHGADGGAAGTPRYMAPELASQPADALSDQYAFASALDELSGARTNGPRWLRAVIERACDPDPARRFPSMTALVAGLERGLGRRRRVVLAAAIAGVAAAATVGGATLFASQPERSACELAARRAYASSSDRSALARKFEGHAGPIPFADVVAVLDAHASSWATAYRSACEAEHAHPTSSGQQRLICLDGHLRQRDAILALTTPADIAAGALALPPPPDCTDAVVAIVPADVGPTTRAAIERVRDRVASATTLDDIGRGDDALARMREAVAEAKRLAIPALEVEVRLALGQLELGDGLASTAETTLRDVAALARRIGDRAGEAEAAVALGAAIVLRGKLAEGARQLDAAEQLVRDAGDSARLRLMVLEARTFLGASHGDPAKVRANAEEQRALVEKLYGREDRRMVTAAISLAASSVAQDPATSRTVIAEARALASRLVGRTHPLLAEIDRAQCIAERGDPAVARRYCEAARSFFEAGGAAYRVPLAKTLLVMSTIDTEHMIELVTAARAGFEPGSVYRAMADSQLAAAHRRTMNYIAATAAARDAVQGYAAAMDREAPPLVQELRWLGRDLLMLGNGEEASEVLARVVEVEGKSATPVPKRVDTLLQLAGAQFYSTTRRDEARATIDRALALAATHEGPDSPVVGEALFSSSALFLEHEQLDEAAITIDRAQRLAARGTPSLRARLALARSTLEAERDHVSLARVAQRRATAEAAKASEPFVTFMVRLADCELLVRERAAARAVEACGALVGVAEAGFGRDHVTVLAVLVPLAEAQLARGEVATARATIDRALEIAVRSPDPRRLAAARYVKVRILDAARDRGAARDLAATALAELARANTAAATAKRLERWLSTHPGRPASP